MQCSSLEHQGLSWIDIVVQQSELSFLLWVKYRWAFTWIMSFLSDCTCAIIQCKLYLWQMIGRHAGQLPFESWYMQSLSNFETNVVFAIVGGFQNKLLN